MLRSHKFLITSLIAALSFVSCGIDKNPHWKNKHFGQTEGENANELPITEVPESQPGSPTEDRDEEHYDKVLSHFGFSGSFELDSVRRILRGSDQINGEISRGSTLDGLLAKLLGLIIGDNTKETLSMRAKQDGQSRNTVQQVVVTEGGDRISAVKGEESQSGVQSLDWALPGSATSSSCPRTFICIDRMVWSPTTGGGKTFCYRDPTTRARVAIPYSANPHFSKEAYMSAIGQGLRSSPIEVVVLRGNTSCDNTEVETIARHLVQYHLHLGDLTGTRLPGFYKKAVIQPILPDNHVIVDYSLYHARTRQPFLPKQGPYIDQLTRLSSRMSYYLSSKEHVIVKIVNTIQSPLKLEGSQVAEFIREAYGDLAAYFVSLIFPADGDTEGAQLNYSIEFCRHLGVVENPVNHCPRNAR